MQSDVSGIPRVRVRRSLPQQRRSRLLHLVYFVCCATHYHCSYWHRLTNVNSSHNRDIGHYPTCCEQNNHWNNHSNTAPGKTYRGSNTCVDYWLASIPYFGSLFKSSYWNYHRYHCMHLKSSSFLSSSIPNVVHCFSCQRTKFAYSWPSIDHVNVDHLRSHDHGCFNGLFSGPNSHHYHY